MIRSNPLKIKALFRKIFHLNELRGDFGPDFTHWSTFLCSRLPAIGCFLLADVFIVR
jgi:hypothetical protein